MFIKMINKYYYKLNSYKLNKMENSVGVRIKKIREEKGMKLKNCIMLYLIKK